MAKEIQNLHGILSFKAKNAVIAVAVLAFALLCSFQTDKVKTTDACCAGGIVTISETTEGLYVPLNGSATYHVKLAVLHHAPPTQEVDITVVSSDTQQFTLDKSSLVFTPENYSTEQTITLTAGNSASVGDSTTNFTESSNDSNYVYSKGYDVATTLYQPVPIAATDLLGQINNNGTPNFLGTKPNGGEKGSPSTKTSLSFSSTVAEDLTNHRLFVADSGNNRVLVYNLDESNNLLDHSADFELGQASVDGSTEFVTNSTGTSRNSLSTPTAVVYDSARNLLFVADNGNHRVLAYNVALTGSTTEDHLQNGENPSYIIGQSGWDETAPGFGTVQFSQDSLWAPTRLAYDSENNGGNDPRLFVSDSNYNVVMVFDVSTTNLNQCAAVTAITGSDINSECEINKGDGSVRLLADNVLGKADFSSNLEMSSVDGAHFNVGNGGISYDPTDKYLYVADNGYNRIMVFNVSPTGSTNADHIQNGEEAINVIGQADLILVVRIEVEVLAQMDLTTQLM